MLRSMYAGVSGLKAHQQQMDVIGNNISNVNTTGFKGSRVTFKEMLSQTINGASSPQGGRGGTNPKQIGLGVQLGSIDKNMGQGSLQSTGKETDVAIQGNGFFIVNDGNQNLYTRAGNTSFDEEGYLVNSASGNRVQGWVANESGEIQETNMDSLEDISLDETMDASATTEASYGDNLNPTLDELNFTDGSDTFEVDDGNETDNINVSLSKGEEENVWDFSLNADSEDTIFSDTSNNNYSGTLVLNADGTIKEIYDGSGTNSIAGGTISLTDVDGGTTAGTDIDVASIGDHINVTNLFEGSSPDQTVNLETNNKQTVSTSIYDSQGVEHNVTFDLLKNGQNQWVINESSVDVSGASATAGTGSWFGGSNHQIEFDENGKIKSGQTVNLQLTPNGGAAEGQEITLDFAQLTQYEGDMTADLDQADGYSQGELKDFTINDSGTIVGSFDNGYNKTLAQIGVAEFANPEGLNKSGETMFSVSNNSGYPKVGAAGSGGKGFISSSKLEMSNVDLAEQFTKMITSQRGFQANSKVITTSDEMLQGLVNIKR